MPGNSIPRHLWAFGIAVLLLALLAASQQMLIAHRHHQAIQQLETCDWTLDTYDIPPNWLPRWFRENTPSWWWSSVWSIWGPPRDDDGNEAFMSLLADALPYFSEVGSIELWDVDNPDVHLEGVGDCHNLVLLSLTDMPLSDTIGLKLSGLQKLQFLNLSSTHITDVTLATLGNCQELRALHISDTPVDGSGLESWQEPRLTVLSLDGTNVSDATVGAIRRFHKLQHLDVGNTQVTDAGIQLLSELTALESLDLDGTRITNQAIAAIGKFRDFQDLSLNSTAVDDAAVAMIADQHPRLYSLCLCETKISDACVPDIVRMPNLGQLLVCDTALSSTALGELAGCKELKFLNIENIPISAPDLEKLLDSPNIENIVVARTHLRDPAVATLKAWHPGGAKVDVSDPWLEDLEEEDFEESEQ